MSENIKYNKAQRLAIYKQVLKRLKEIEADKNSMIVECYFDKDGVVKFYSEPFICNIIMNLGFMEYVRNIPEYSEIIMSQFPELEMQKPHHYTQAGWWNQHNIVKRIYAVCRAIKLIDDKG